MEQNGSTDFTMASRKRSKMTRSDDPWLFQDDVRKNIETYNFMNSKWITIYEDLDLPFEHHYSVIIPIPHSKMAKSLADYTWSSEFDWSRGNIHAHQKVHFLSRCFLNRIDLKCLGNTYIDITGATSAQLTTSGLGIGRIRKIKIKTNLVREFLESMNQSAVRLQRTQRYTERDLAEFGEQKIRDLNLRSASYNYVYEQDALNNGVVMGRERFKTFTMTLGKTVVFARN